MAKAAEIIKDTELFESKSGSDTLRLWENYREQATLWRALALIQVPATFIALIFALILWSTREITLNVPAKPLPGTYAAREIPDTEFINVATNFVNLVATYQSAIAERQFLEARKILIEPMLAKFNSDMLGIELRTIISTDRAQVLFIDPTKTSIERVERDVIISLVGDRVKWISGRELPPVPTSFHITLTTVPRNTLNPYGIVVKNVKVRKIED